MKAILRGGACLLGLLLTGSISFGYILVSPVFKQPYPQAPDLQNSASYYVMDSWGRIHGPYHYLVPPCQPFGGMLPGKTGQAIMSGNLPHTLLMSKEGLAIGNVPLVGQKHAKGTPPQAGGGPGAGLPEMGGPSGAYMTAGGPSTLGYPNPPAYAMPNMQVPYGQAPRMNYPMVNPNMQVPYGAMPYPMPSPYPMQPPYNPMPYGAQPMPYGAQPMPYGAQPMPYGAQPMPYGAQPMPYGAQPMPYGAQPMPYGAQPMPYGAQPMPYGAQPMPYGAQPMPYPLPMQQRPLAYYPMSMGNYARYYDPRSGVSQAQNVAPGPQPFMPIPGFAPPGAPRAPGMPMPPMAPMPPGMGSMDAGGNGSQFNGPMQQAAPFNQFTPLNPLQPMQPPMMQMQPMQLPRMDYVPPPAQKVGGNMYPTHPFVRSPRDFFMWGENMEDEERMRKRPQMVP